MTWIGAGQFAGAVTSATASSAAWESPTGSAWHAPGPIGPKSSCDVTLVAAQVARPQRAVGHRGRADGPAASLDAPTAPAPIAGARTAPAASSPDRTAPRAIAADRTALGRSFAALTERLAGVLSVRRARDERSLAARLPSRILAPVTELPTRREPEIASWAAAGPPSATNSATDDSTSAADGRRA